MNCYRYGQTEQLTVTDMANPNKLLQIRTEQLFSRLVRTIKCYRYGQSEHLTTRDTVNQTNSLLHVLWSIKTLHCYNHCQWEQLTVTDKVNRKITHGWGQNSPRQRQWHCTVFLTVTRKNCLSSTIHTHAIWMGVSHLFNSNIKAQNSLLFQHLNR